MTGHFTRDVDPSGMWDRPSIGASTPTEHKGVTETRAAKQIHNFRQKSHAFHSAASKRESANTQKILTKLSSKSTILTNTDPLSSSRMPVCVKGTPTQESQKLPGTGFTVQTRYWESLGRKNATRLRSAAATIVGSRPASETLSQNQKMDKHIKPDHKPALGSWGWEGRGQGRWHRRTRIKGSTGYLESGKPAWTL